MPIRSQSTAAFDRPDIRFYGADGDTSLADLATDLGQYESDLTVGAGTDVVYLPSPATRFSLNYPRTIAMRLTVAHSTNSVLWNHGSAAQRDRLQINASNYEWAIGGTAAFITAPVPAGTSQIIVLRSEPNPGATVPSNEVMTTLEIYDATNSVLTRYTVNHAARSLPTADFAFLALNSTGTSSYIDAGGECSELRFSSRAVPFTEIAQDWIASLSDPSSDALLVRQGLPLTEDSGIGDVGEFHGAAVQFAASELRHNQLRTMGALANWMMYQTPEVTEFSPTSTSGREKIKLAPGGNVGTGYRLRLGWFGVFPVHPMANALWVQVHARCYNATDADLRTFGFRLYSFSRKPVIGPGFVLPGEEPEPLDYRYAQATFTSDEAAPGSWRVQATLPIAVGQSGISKGMTYLGLAYAIDLNDEGTESLRIAVKSIHAVQLFDATVGAPQGGGPSGEAGS